MQQNANDRLIMKSVSQRNTDIVRTFPHAFEVASDLMVPVGSQADLSDLKIKYSWQKDDDLVGVPYPNKS